LGLDNDCDWQFEIGDLNGLDGDIIPQSKHHNGRMG
jgi:hypothetical protein